MSANVRESIGEAAVPTAPEGAGDPPRLARTWRTLKAIGAAIAPYLGFGAFLALVLYLALDLFEFGGVSVPKAVPVDPKHVTRLNASQGWPDGWGPNQAQWFHHASQGTRILPYDWFVNLERPSLSVYFTPARLVEGDYLQRFGFLPGESDDVRDASGKVVRAGRFNPGGLLPIGFAIEEEFAAPYAKPPSPAREDDPDGPAANPRGPRSEKVVGLTCAACHTGQLTYRDGDTLKAIRVEGGSAMINLSAFQQAVGLSLAYTWKFDARFTRFARRALGPDYDPANAQKLRDRLKAFLDVGQATLEYSRVHKLNGTEGGFSRTDALGLIGNRVFSGIAPENQIVTDAPVNFPPLWDTAWFDWVQYNASIRMPMVRNIGEALGVGAAVNLDGQPSPRAEAPGGSSNYESTVNVKNLHLLEEQLGGAHIFEGLQPPTWPGAAFKPPDRAMSDAGATLYRDRCQRCHLPPRRELVALAKKPGTCGFEEHFDVDPASKAVILKVKTFDLHEIGTDPNQAMNLYRRVAVMEGETLSAARGLFAVTEFIRRAKYAGLSPGEVRAWDRFRSFDEGTPKDVRDGTFINQVLRANLKYKARPLDGIWATPPYLHNSSVPNLDQLLQPVACRAATFSLGSTLYDPEHLGFETDEFPGAFRMDTSLPGNLNTGHEYRNLTLEEFESIAEYHGKPGPTDLVRARWGRVLSAALGRPAAEFATLEGVPLWEAIRRATRAALELPRVRRDHPFPGVLGPEFSGPERANLLEYLKTL